MTALIDKKKMASRNVEADLDFAHNESDMTGQTSSGLLKSVMV